MRGSNNFITGAIILGISGVVARFLGLFFRWPVTMLIGDEGIGLYQLSYPVYMFIIGIMSGFPIAISSMVSKRVALGRGSQAHKVFKTSLAVLIFIGALSSLLLFISSPYLIKVLRWRDEAYYSLVAVAFAPLFVAVMNAYRGYFQGLQMMAMPATSQIVEQLGRVMVGVLLTYFLLPFGIGYGAAGASFGACAGAVLGCIVLGVGYLKYKRHMNKWPSDSGKENTAAVAVELLSTAIPISIGMTVASIMSLIDSIIVPAQLLSAGFGEKMATELYGQLTGKAHVLINVPLTFSVALGTSLVPAMSEVKALRNISRIKLRAQNAVTAAILVGLPSSLGLFILSDPILHLIFPGHSEGAEVLQILSLSVVFIVLAQTLVSLLHGVGNMMAPVRNLAIGAVFKLFFAYVLTGMPSLNVKGAAISSIIGYFVAAVLNLRDAAKCTYFSFDIDKMLLRPLLVTILMGITVYISYNKFIILTGMSGLSTIFSVITGIIVYVFLIIMSGCISIKDIISYINIKPKK